MKVNRNRVIKSVEAETLYFDGLSLQEAYLQLQALISTYGPAAKISEQLYQHTDVQYLAIMVQETDAEMEQRIACEERVIAQHLAYQRTEYEKLKSMFDGAN